MIKSIEIGSNIGSKGDIDKEVEDLINQSNMSTKATQNRLKRWQDLVQNDITTTNKKWDEKMLL